MGKPWQNKSGCNDPTAYAVMKEDGEQLKRVNTLISVLKYITRNAGFEVIGRIQLRDLKNGREYK